MEIDRASQHGAASLNAFHSERMDDCGWAQLAAKADSRQTKKVSDMTVDIPKTHYFEDLTIGLSESLTHIVTSDDVVSFANISGDRNPIHLSEEYARTTRFGRRIAHGLYTASLISAVLGMRLPGPGAVYLHQTLNFKAPVHIGDEVNVRLEVVELSAKGRRAKLACIAEVDGKVVLDGEATVMVPSREQAAKSVA
jgi:3-hydroxybutyryl-CoA dehydratase